MTITRSQSGALQRVGSTKTCSAASTASTTAIATTTTARTSSSKYAPLDEVRKTLRIQWYRCPVGGGQLRHLMERSDFQGALQTFGHLALWLCTGWLVMYLSLLDDHGSSATTITATTRVCGLLAAMFLHGTVGSCFLFGCHELGHGTVFRTKPLNRFFLYVLSLLSWWDPFDYAMSHTYHHRFTQHPAADRENVRPVDPVLSPRVLFEQFTVVLMGGPGRVFGKGGLLSHVYLFGRAALGMGPPSDMSVPQNEWLASLHAICPEEARRSMYWSQFVLAFHTAVHAVAYVTGLWALPLVVSWHSFCANWLRFFMGFTQHCGLRDNVPDFRKSTRTITLDPLSEFLYWHMNWHIEHHMFAGCPCYNLPALHRAVAQDMPKPRTLIGAWREMRETWQKRIHQPGYCYDTPVPSGSGYRKDSSSSSSSSSSPDASVSSSSLGASIGDLAPETLR